MVSLRFGYRGFNDIFDFRGFFQETFMITSETNECNFCHYLHYLIMVTPAGTSLSQIWSIGPTERNFVDRQGQ